LKNWLKSFLKNDVVGRFIFGLVNSGIVWLGQYFHAKKKEENKGEIFG